MGNDTRISEYFPRGFADQVGNNSWISRRSADQVGNEVCLNGGKGKAFLYSVLSDLSCQGLKRRYSKGYYGSIKTKPLDGHLNPIREFPGSPLNAQKPSRATRKSPRLLPLSLTTITMFSVLRQNPCK